MIAFLVQNIRRSSFHFRVGRDACFSPYNNALDVEQFLGFPSDPICIDFQEGYTPMHPPPHQDSTENRAFLSLANRIGDILNCPMIEPLFVSRMNDRLRMLYPTVVLKSQPVRTICQFPRLFPIELRAFAVKMLSMDHATAATVFLERFGRVENFGANLSALPLSIRRDSLARDAADLGRYVLIGRIPIRVVFHGEAGLGPGLLKEFFTEFARALCRPSYGLFRSSSVTSEFCEDKQGLFLHPRSEPQQCLVLGVLCAKAISLNLVIDIPFNPVFFKLMMNRRVRLAEVDAVLARSLRQPGASLGLPFTYPGIPELLLSPDGDNLDVDESNSDLYLRLVEEHTCGSIRFATRIASFLRGFDSVLSWACFKDFTADEMCCLVRGEGVNFTETGLREHVIYSHGYESDSKQVHWFQELVLEMTTAEQTELLQFITGFRQFPIGGLAAFTPQLTVTPAGDTSVEERELMDQMLPSAATCTNHLRLPRYSTKEIMSERLRHAVEIGNHSFEIT
jgi:hypothetical protein